MEDIELQLKAELLRPLGKIPKTGVENWLKAVKEMIREARAVENKVNVALMDEDTCMDGFASRAMNGYAKMMLRKRIIKITHLTSNVLALINNYASS
ncbi:hypothetical protein Gotur_026516 [Gossypium turneri]